MKHRQLWRAFGPVDGRRIEQHLVKLRPYLSGEFVLSGSLALVYWLEQTDLELPSRPLNDVDLAMRDWRVLDPQAGQDFMIAHFHPQDNYFAVVEPQTKTKADLFEWLPVNHDYRWVRLGEADWPLLSLEALFVIAVHGLAQKLPARPVEPKRLADAQLMLPYVDRAKVKLLWRQLGQTADPINQLKKVQQIVLAQPKLLVKQTKTYALTCAECANQSAYQLTPLAQVYDLLQIEYEAEI